MPDLSENLPDRISEPMATIESDSTEETPSPSPNEPTDSDDIDWTITGLEGANTNTNSEQPATDQETSDSGNPFSEQGDEEYDQDERNDLAKCVEWSQSENVVTRQQAARALPQCLYEVATVCNERQMTQLSQIITRLHKDSDPQVRVDLLDVLTHLSIICLDRNDSMALAISNLAGRHLPLPPNPLLVKLHRGTIIPCLLRLMKDRALQIRKLSHYVLLRMLECKLIAPPIITREVLPTVLELARSGKDQTWSVDMTSGDTSDQRQEAASLLSKLIQYVDKDQVTTYYLPAFLKLCNDESFHVRRACAAAMCELCQVLDAECIQNSLLTTFLSLCTDPAWSVRKSCTESFMTISCVVEPKLRREALAPRFLHLLSDRAKWVTASAYQNLGPFISTFADPKRTGLELVRPEGAGQEAAVRRMANYDAPIHNPHEDSWTPVASKKKPFNNTYEVLPDVVKESYDLPDVVNKTTEPVSDSASTILDSRTTFASSNPDDATNNNGISSKQSTKSNRRSDVNFNGFLYWRSPLPDVDSLKVCEGESESSGATTSDAAAQPESMENPSIEKSAEEAMQNLEIADKVDSTESEAEVKESSQSDTVQTGETQNNAQNGSTLKTMSQDGDNHQTPTESEDKNEMADCGVPLDLLEHFKQMLDSDVCHNVDCVDLPRSCAYSLPAVALALGPKYWRHYLLSPLFDLYADVQWQVRHSIASSLHSLVVIVGDRDAVNYILPMFDNYSRDLDEVRLPLLRTLHQICVNLEPESRKVILDSLFEFTKSENDRSWRLRDELAKQLTLISEHYEFSDRFRYFIPIIALLLKDKVAQVRSSAAECVASVIWSGPMSISEKNATIQTSEKSHVVNSNESLNSSSGSDSGGSGRKICPPIVKATDSSSSDDCSYYDRLQLVLKTLWGNNVLVTKWQHLQAFIQALVGVVSRIPESVNILKGCDSNTNAQFDKKLSAICSKNQALRNIIIVMSVLQPYLLEGVRHRVANVRLKCASLMSTLINKIAQACSTHSTICVECKQHDTLNSALMAIRDSTVLRKSGQGKRCVLKVKVSAQEENHIPPSDAPAVDSDNKQDDDKASETNKSAKPVEDGDTPSETIQLASKDDCGVLKEEDEAAKKLEEEKIRSLVMEKCKLFSAVGLNVCTTPVQSLAFDSEFDVMRIVLEALGFSFEELLPSIPPQDVSGNIQSSLWTEE